MSSQKEVKLLRLRDIALYHLSTVGEISVRADNLERDIKVWVKNFLMTLHEIDATIIINWVGDNNPEKDSLQTEASL